MEIETIAVRADYCFGDSPIVFGNLKKVNFIFAPNGAGKSTISAALSRQPSTLADRPFWDVAPTDLPIRVFNEAYRSRVLTEQVDGIFTIGETSNDVNKKIAELQSGKRGRQKEIEKWEQDIGSGADPQSLSGLLGDIEGARIAARGSIFDAHKEVDNAVAAVIFEGFRTKRDKFLAESLRRYKEKALSGVVVNWGEIKRRTNSLSGDKKRRSSLTKIDTVSLISAPDIAEVGTKSSHDGSGEFAKLIQSLGNEDWVSEGRDYIDEAGGKCPFCQRETADNLEEQLSQYFKGGFDAALQRSNEIERSAKTSAAKLEEELTSLEISLTADPAIVEDAFSSSIANVREAAELLLSHLRERAEHPTQPITVADVHERTAELNVLVDAENVAIDEHNRLVANSGDERVKLIDDGWNAFLAEPVVNREIKRLMGISSSKERRIAELQARIADAKQADVDADRDITTLRNSVSNTAQVAEKINMLLTEMGFHRFHLRVADETTGSYRIAREDGTQAFSSLSEGEKSFICFAYFWESLFGTAAANDTPEDVVAVIDDPISSLDSDSLFMIASFIRDAADDAISGSSNLRQLIVLTHNTQFHHEAAYSADRNSSQRRYFRLVKTLKGVTEVRDDGRESKIRGSYALLWHSIVDAARSDDESDLVRVGVFNIARRILEGYFKTIGRVRDFNRPGDASPVESRVISQFHVWANSGSHTIADDIDQTVDVGRTKDFLRLFRRYFDIQGHDAHFDMMIEASDGADLLSPGQLFARS